MSSKKVINLATFKAARNSSRTSFVKAVIALCEAAGDVRSDERFIAESEVYRIWTESMDEYIALSEKYRDLLQKKLDR